MMTADAVSDTGLGDTGLAMAVTLSASGNDSMMPR
jgi:hypothetical protein